MEKIGLERRIYTAGEKKSMLDPFCDENAEDINRLKSLQSEMHQSFKHAVKDRRGGRLKGDDNELFSGEFWSGRQAHELGLIDGIGDLRSVMKDRFGEKVRFKIIEPKKQWWKVGSKSLSSRKIADSTLWIDDLIAIIEERFFWSRFGL